MQLRGQQADAEAAEPFTGADAKGRAAPVPRYTLSIQNQ